MRRTLPSGTVTFLFTDVEGSTRLLHELGPEAYAAALQEHRSVLRQAFVGHDGVEVDTQGDAFFVAFPTAPGAIAAARAAQEALASGPIRVRMGLHAGTPHVTEEGYVGADVHLGARIAAVGHGGQVLLSREARVLVDGDDFLDLGEHRLKDFTEAVPIFQLGSETFPPLRSISNTNLPRPASSFVGRDHEVRELATLLQEDARLVTLTGPGGSGKTRLAIEAAAELVPQFKAGVFWVGLAALRDSTVVTETIAQTLGAKDGIADHVGERELLLLLDNLEQVVEAAPELAELVESCPNLRLLVTSRELLRVRGEVEYPVLPLAASDAVELFCTRAHAEPEKGIDELCEALDNLPLAVELAAARASVLTPKQILDRLSQRLDLLRGGRDADPRQQTLRATIEWSYELLTPDERQLVARLAVFRGGCTLDAAEVVCEASLDLLQSLVEKSLLRRTGDRFWMLETIREYAAERLERSGEAEEVRRRSAEYVFALAEEAEPHILGLSPGQWLDRLEREHDNLRAALEWFEASGETQRALQLGGAVWEFWCLREHFSEGLRRLEQLLEIDQRPTLARAKALTGLVHLAPGTNTDPASIVHRAEEALGLHRQMGDAWGIAYAESQYAQSLSEVGEFATAQPLLEESVQRLRDVGDEHRELQAMRLLAWACLELGDGDRYRTLHEEILSRARAAGDQESQAWSLASLAFDATSNGRHRDALTLLEESYAVARDFGDRSMVDMTMVRLAEVLANADRPQAAVRLFSVAAALHEELDWSYPGWLRVRKDAAMEKARTALDDRAFAEAWEAGQKLSADDAVELAASELNG